MSIIQDEIQHLTGVLASLPSDHPRWTVVQNQIADLRARAQAEAALPKRPMVPVDIKDRLAADLEALEKLAGGGGA